MHEIPPETTRDNERCIPNNPSPTTTNTHTTSLTPHPRTCTYCTPHFLPTLIQNPRTRPFQAQKKAKIYSYYHHCQLAFDCLTAWTKTELLPIYTTSKIERGAKYPLPVHTCLNRLFFRHWRHSMYPPDQSMTASAASFCPRNLNYATSTHFITFHPNAFSLIQMENNLYIPSSPSGSGRVKTGPGPIRTFPFVSLPYFLSSAPLHSIPVASGKTPRCWKS